VNTISLQNNQPSNPQRRPSRLREYDYSAPGAYFVTLCTQKRQCTFGEVEGGRMDLNAAGQSVREVWEQLPARYPGVETDAFVVMPNHLHGLLMVTVGAIHELPLREKPDTPPNVERRNMLLPKVTGFFKMNSAKLVNRIRQTPGQPVWQRGYYEHVVRRTDRMDRIQAYILHNPLLWELDQENQQRIEPEKRRGGF